MKRASRFLLLLLIGLTPIQAKATEGLRPSDLVAICGDSITAAQIYSVDIEAYLLMCQPEPDLMAMQFGLSGEVGGGFLARLKNDVLPFKPTVATTCYGMNDGGYAALTAQHAQLYRDAMQKIVQAFKDGGVRFIVIGSPGAVDTTSFKLPGVTPEIYNQTLEQLGAIAKEVAEKNSVTFADIHHPMVDVMARAKQKYGNDYLVCGTDGIHAGPNGQLIMAYAFLKALGCSGNIGTITYDMRSLEAKATDGHKILSVKNGTISIESSKYPFCFAPDPASTGTRSILEFLPFNQDLNRFLLVVKNAFPGQYKVTWGTSSKEFSSADLAEGINLAAAFLDNPFSAPFKAVTKRINAQQYWEYLMIKRQPHSLLGFRTDLPEEEAVYAQLTAKIVQRSAPIREASRAAIVPVIHSITIQKI